MKTWTVKTNRGATVASNVPDIQAWLKHHTGVLVVATLAAIKTIIIYE